MDTPESSPSTNEPRLVRPYPLTAGRTNSAVDIPLEAPLEVLPAARTRQWRSNDLRGEIVARCAARPSVAEIAAGCNLPLGVARVLVGDLVAEGLVRVMPTLTDRSTTDERRELIGRTLRGLRALGRA